MCCVEFEQKGQLRAEYGEELLQGLSADMTVRFGKGLSERNLRNMRAFYLNFPIRQTVSGKFKPMLSGSHYFELLKVEEPLEGTAVSQYANIPQ
jgi:hypothetical protein